MCDSKVNGSNKSRLLSASRINQIAQDFIYIYMYIKELHRNKKGLTGTYYNN